MLPEYPRPQLQRDSYLNLNGVWRYAITASAAPPETWDGDILVPFSPECVLSGVERVLAPGEYLWYSRSFTLPEGFSRGRVLLNFGAVDQTATVYLNGQELLTHVGGYLPFTVELTAALAAENQLAVRVRDDTDEDWHTRGKQKRKRGGIWYTAQSGIWQTVWLESVPAAYIKRLAITPGYDGGLVEIGAEVAGKTRPVAHFGGADYPLPARIPVPDFEPWSPENPRLYDFTVTCGDDEVKSYFAMPDILCQKFLWRKNNEKDSCSCSCSVHGAGTVRLRNQGSPRRHRRCRYPKARQPRRRYRGHHDQLDRGQSGHLGL